MELPVLLSRRYQQNLASFEATPHQFIPTGSLPEERVDTCPHQRRNTFRHEKSTSADSGLGEKAIQQDVNASKSNFSLGGNVESQTSRVGIRKSSTGSLPTELVKESGLGGERKKESKWKTLFRTSSRPELFRHSSEEGTNATSHDPNPTSYRDLLMEAVMILDEAQARGSNLYLNENETN